MNRSIASFGLDLLGAVGIGTAGGILFGAADTFLIDRIAKGWKPDRFVNGAFQAFVRKC